MRELIEVRRTFKSTVPVDLSSQYAAGNAVVREFTGCIITNIRKRISEGW